MGLIKMGKTDNIITIIIAYLIPFLLNANRPMMTMPIMARLITPKDYGQPLLGNYLISIWDEYGYSYLQLLNSNILSSNMWVVANKSSNYDS